MSTDRLCPNCDKSFPATPQHWYRNGKYLSGYCKKCTLKVNAQWKRDNPKKNCEYNKKWRNKNRVKARAIWKLATATYAATNVEKIRVRNAFQAAHRKREIDPEPCEVCGASRVHGHHWRYDLDHALAVNWLCRDHHMELHTILGRLELEDSEKRSQELINVMKKSHLRGETESSRYDNKTKEVEGDDS
jgi:hypothetical protein